MSLEYFQEQTVDAAVAALSRPAASRRFLIADEVGLGKTICSKAIAAALQAGRGSTLNVVYFCPNLGIASQNLTKLRSLDRRWTTPPDRLSLACRDPVGGGVDFRLFCYTPDTSLPGWRTNQRTGRVVERELIAGVTSKVAPLFWRRVRYLDRVREHGGHPRVFGHRPDPPKHLREPYRHALAKVLGLAESSLEAGLRGWIDRHGDLAEFVLRARAALTLVALKDSRTKPHLLILDEFHRYADLILPRPPVTAAPLIAERSAVHALLVEALIGGTAAAGRPGVLLLSATPYRLQRADGGDIETGRYGGFVGLVKFLFGDEGKAEADEAVRRIAAHHLALQATGERKRALRAVHRAKRQVEAALFPVIARTERATSATAELFDRRATPARVTADDLATFRHFARAVDRKTPRLRSWVTPLWSSVPYPAETLFGYKVCRALTDLPAVTSALGLANPAHPQLRSLLVGTDDAAPPFDRDMLGLPWLPPTEPWWQLGGAWAGCRSAGKSLLFSRYHGTPAAVSLLLSQDVHERNSRKQKGKSKFSAQAFLRFSAKAPWPLIASFMPWGRLSQAVDLCRDPEQEQSAAKLHARRSLGAWLKRNDFVITRQRGTPRKAWLLAFEVESALGGGEGLAGCLRRIAALKPSAWRKLLEAKARTISVSEIRLLADFLVSAPGSVVGRSLLRHQPEVFSDVALRVRAFEFCWHRLRLYLGQRYFSRAILPARRSRSCRDYPKALQRAVLDGGLEAVLDEHLAVMQIVGDETPLDYLAQAIITRPGRLRLRKSKGSRPVNAHAAIPYAGGERRVSGKGKPQKLRADSLRRAFNSPFWPHLLSTTSIGQEGLDFHVWCDQVVHWDLPRDPVDFEQREGRIARYASLSVRRSLAREFRGAAEAAGPGDSPFMAIFEAARAAKATDIGLERWWCPQKHKPVSITFALRSSLGEVRLKRLQRDLATYRLALGQPEPRLFEELIRHFQLAPGEARQLALNLSATNRPAPA